MSDEALKRKPMNVDYRVQVAYTVPVEVIVDLEKGTVERAVVINEEVTLDHKEGARKESILHPVSDEVAGRATEIAEAGNWPTWEFGF